MQTYLSAIRNHVCAECSFAVHGGDNQFFYCSMADEMECAIKRHLDTVVRVVGAVERPTAEKCLVDLRAFVCAGCDEFHCGQCPLTGIGSCTLDSQFSNVVEAIIDVSEHSECLETSK